MNQNLRLKTLGRYLATRHIDLVTDFSYTKLVRFFLDLNIICFVRLICEERILIFTYTIFIYEKRMCIILAYTAIMTQ